MEQAGLSDSQLCECLRELVEGKETRFISHQGHVTEIRDVINLGAKARGLDMAFKLKGLYP
jgi:hypothetical protein